MSGESRNPGMVQTIIARGLCKHCSWWADLIRPPDHQHPECSKPCCTKAEPGKRRSAS